ncbi:RND transporter [Shimia aestuarii]|uniref:RND transporter n=1 Tax=Shimia aestuarii TaxID=254406 RepID=UPI001FB1AE26|nr:RND transporter [Shimia aestuarii]
MAWIDRLRWRDVTLVALLLGLAPFLPEPHLWEKLKMLGAGTLVRPLDWFDLAMHGAPVLVLAIKGLRSGRSG